MTRSSLAARDHFTQFTASLLSLIQNLEADVAALRLSVSDSHSSQSVYVKQMASITAQLDNIGLQLSAAHILTLFEEECTDLCDLMICGGELYAYLTASKSTSQALRRRANRWKKLAAPFKQLIALKL